MVLADASASVSPMGPIDAMFGVIALGRWTRRRGTRGRAAHVGLSVGSPPTVERAVEVLGHERLPAAGQGIAPAEQLLIRRTNNAERTRLITTEPRQPNRFEKKTNI